MSVGPLPVHIRLKVARQIGKNGRSGCSVKIPPSSSKLPRPTQESVAYYLGVAYAANIGGTGTLTGTATNLTFKGLYER